MNTALAGNEVTSPVFQRLPATRRVVKVLFASSGNTGRSQMAEALAEYYLRSDDSISALLAAKDMRLVFQSAGLATDPSRPQINPHAVTALRERGIWIDPSKPAGQISPDTFGTSDFIFSMTKNHLDLLKDCGGDPNRVYILRQMIAGIPAATLEIPNPLGSSLEVYRRSRDLIQEALPCLVKAICNSDGIPPLYPVAMRKLQARSVAAGASRSGSLRDSPTVSRSDPDPGNITIN